MMLRVVSIVYLASMGLMIQGCGGQSSENSQSSSLFCPSEKDTVCASAQALAVGESPRIFCYRTVSRDEFLGNDPKARFGVEVSEEIRKSRDLLNGTGIETRRTCSRAFVMENGSRRYLEADRVPGSAYVTEAREEKDFLLLSNQVGAKAKARSEIAQLRMSQGRRTTLASESTPLGGCYPALEAHASPSGDYIAQLKLMTPCGSEPSRSDVTVKVFDANATTVGEPWTESFTPGVSFQWINDSSYTLQDNERTVSKTVN